MQSDFRLSVVKLHPKSMPWRITMDANCARSQSNYEAISCGRRQARENRFVYVAVGFGLSSDWLTKWRINNNHFSSFEKLLTVTRIFLLSFNLSVMSSKKVRFMFFIQKTVSLPLF